MLKYRKTLKNLIFTCFKISFFAASIFTINLYFIFKLSKYWTLKFNKLWNESLLRFWIFLKPKLPELLLKSNFLVLLEINTKKFPLKTLMNTNIILFIYQLAFFNPKNKDWPDNSRIKILESLNFLCIDLERPEITHMLLTLVLKEFLLTTEYIFSNENRKAFISKWKYSIFTNLCNISCLINTSLLFISLIFFQYLI